MVEFGINGRPFRETSSRVKGVVVREFLKQRIIVSARPVACREPSSSNVNISREDLVHDIGSPRRQPVQKTSVPTQGGFIVPCFFNWMAPIRVVPGIFVEQSVIL